MAAKRSVLQPQAGVDGPERTLTTVWCCGRARPDDVRDETPGTSRCRRSRHVAAGLIALAVTTAVVLMVMWSPRETRGFAVPHVSTVTVLGWAVSSVCTGTNQPFTRRLGAITLSWL